MKLNSFRQFLLSNGNIYINDLIVHQQIENNYIMVFCLSIIFVVNILEIFRI